MMDGAELISARLLQIRLRLDESGAERLSISDVMDGLGDRSFGSLMLVLALPAMFLPPVASAFLGVPLVVISAQLAAGHRRPWLPRRLRGLSMGRVKADEALHRIGSAVRRLENALRPRLQALLHPWHLRAAAGACILLSVVLMLPVPFAHTAAGLGVGAFGAGLIERDGLALIAGWALTLGCALLMGLVIAGATLGFHLL